VEEQKFGFVMKNRSFSHRRRRWRMRPESGSWSELDELNQTPVLRMKKQPKRNLKKGGELVLK
jgi:hypothetical protein